MAFGFGNPRTLPAGMSAEQIAAILAAAQPGSAEVPPRTPFGFGPLTPPTSAPSTMPGAAGASSPTIGSLFGDASGPLSPGGSVVDGQGFDGRFNQGPPGQGYGVAPEAVTAMRSGLLRQAPGTSPSPSSVPPQADVSATGSIVDDASVASPKPSRPLSFGPLPGASPAPSRADMPAPGAMPISAQGAPGFAVPGSDTSAPAPDAAPGGGFLSALSNPRVYNTLLGIGQGLLSTKGFGPGFALGTAQASKLNREQAATDLAGAEYGLKARKLQQETAGQNQTVEMLVRGGHPRETAQAMVQAAAGGNRDALNNAMNNLVPKVDAGSGYTMQGGRASYIPGGPQDPATIAMQSAARETDKRQTPLTTPEARAAVGIAANDTRPAWSDPDGKVTFDAGPKAQVSTMVGPGGEKVSRIYNPTTGTFDAPDYGASPPRSSIDTSNVPPGVDPATYRREMAKGVAAEQKGASMRALQARDALPMLDRAERAYSDLAKGSGIGPYAASGFNRAVTGAFGAQNEIARQEYEAAAKELELTKAQISMKGQGAITESERAILRMTLPRLDAASPETGMNTLRGMREQFNRTMSADRLPSRSGAATAVPAPVMPAQPSRDTLEAEARRRGLIR